MAFDLLYSSSANAEWQKTRESIGSAIQTMSRARHSKIAMRGTRLLTTLLQRVTDAATEQVHGRKRKLDSSGKGTKRPKRFDTRSFVHDFLEVESAETQGLPSSDGILSESSRRQPRPDDDDMLNLFTFGQSADPPILTDALDIPWEMFDGGNQVSLIGESPLHDIFCGL